MTIFNEVKAMLDLSPKQSTFAWSISDNFQKVPDLPNSDSVWSVTTGIYNHAVIGYTMQEFVRKNLYNHGWIIFVKDDDKVKIFFHFKN